MAPQVPHIPTLLVIAVLALIDLLLMTIGLKRFNSKAIG